MICKALWRDQFPRGHKLIWCGRQSSNCTLAAPDAVYHDDHWWSANCENILLLMIIADTACVLVTDICTVSHPFSLSITHVSSIGKNYLRKLVVYLLIFYLPLHLIVRREIVLCYFPYNSPALKINQTFFLSKPHYYFFNTFFVLLTLKCRQHHVLLMLPLTVTCCSDSITSSFTSVCWLSDKLWRSLLQSTFLFLLFHCRRLYNTLWLSVYFNTGVYTFILTASFWQKRQLRHLHFISQLPINTDKSHATEDSGYVLSFASLFVVTFL